MKKRWKAPLSAEWEVLFDLQAMPWLLWINSVVQTGPSEGYQTFCSSRRIWADAGLSNSIARLRNGYDAVDRHRPDKRSAIDDGVPDGAARLRH